MPTQPKDHFCFIIHGVIPYCYDFNTILALPSGFRYRNRFDTPWVDPNLRGGSVGDLVGEDVLLILRDVDKNRLVPVRWGTIRLAQQVGRIYYFEYVLGPLVRYSSDSRRREAEVAEHTATLSRFHPALPGEQGEPLRCPSVFRSVAGREMATADPQDLAEWGNTTYALTTAPIYKQVEFLNVIGLFDLDGRRCAVEDEHLVVRPNTVYQLRVFQTIPVPDDVGDLRPHDIAVETFRDHIVQLRSRQRAVGKYDMLNFVLKTKALPPRERSAIEIPHVPHHVQGDYAPSSLYLPVVTPPRSRKLVVLWVIAVIGSLVAMFSPGSLPGDDDIVRNVATVAFVLLVSGWANTSSGLWPDLPWIRSKA